jgi:hypothetical protein
MRTDSTHREYRELVVVLYMFGCIQDEIVSIACFPPLTRLSSFTFIVIYITHVQIVHDLTLPHGYESVDLKTNPMSQHLLGLCAETPIYDFGIVDQSNTPNDLDKSLDQE